MADLRIAIVLLGALVACCSLVALGVYFSRRTEVTRVYATSGVIALLALIIFVIYAAFYLVTK